MVYGGMRFENRATDDDHARAVLARMFDRHGITAAKSNPLAGRVNVTGARVRVTLIPDPAVPCADCGADVDPLDVFPGNRCLDCHAGNPAVRGALATMTADRLARMWGGAR